MSHGRIRNNQSNLLLLNITDNGAAMKTEIDYKLDSDLPSNNPWTSYIKMFIWFKDTKQNGGQQETGITQEDGEWIAIRILTLP